jgi:hypothetical protein
MMTFATIRTLPAALALGLAATTALAAPEPTLSDIAGCNEQAASRTGASALPHPGWRTPGPVDRNPSISPRADATKPSVVPGPADRGVGTAPKPDVGSPAPGSGGPAEKTDPSGAIISQSPDPLVKGMDAGKADDPQYRAAYRECMRAKIGAR